MNPLLNEVCGASLPAASLGVLAELRCAGDVRATVAGDRAWVRWRAGDERVLGRLLPVPGVELFARRGAAWYAFGHRLQAGPLPLDDDLRLLSAVLTPAPFPARPPEDSALSRVFLRLVRSDVARTTTAMLCPLAALLDWAESVTSFRLASLQAARLGDRALVLGSNLPALGGERFWGDAVLVPLGWRPEPELPADAVREALGATDEELALLTSDGAEVIPREVFQPLTRAGLRLAQTASIE